MKNILWLILLPLTLWLFATTVEAGVHVKPCDGELLPQNDTYVVSTTTLTEKNSKLPFRPSQIYNRWPGQYGSWFRFDATREDKKDEKMWEKRQLRLELTAASNTPGFAPNIYVYIGDCTYERFLTGIISNYPVNTESTSVSVSFDALEGMVYILVTGYANLYGSFNLSYSVTDGAQMSYDFPLQSAAPIDMINSLSYVFLNELRNKPNPQPSTLFPSISSDYGMYFYYKLPLTEYSSSSASVITSVTFFVDKFYTNEYADAEIFAFYGNSSFIDGLIALDYSKERVEFPIYAESEYYVLMTGNKNKNFAFSQLNNSLSSSNLCDQAIDIETVCASDHEFVNDRCNIATFLASKVASSLQTPVTECAGSEQADGYGYYGAWYKYTHRMDDKKMVFSTDNQYSTLDSQMFIFDSCKSTATCVGYNDDNRPGTCVSSTNAKVELDCEFGKTYYILITGKQEGGGLYVLFTYEYVEKGSFPWEVPVFLASFVLVGCCCRCCITVNAIQCVVGIFVNLNKRRKYTKSYKKKAQVKDSQQEELVDLKQESDTEDDKTSSASVEDTPKSL